MNGIAVVLIFGVLLSSSLHAQEAADAYFDPETMERARHEIRHHHGGQVISFLSGERVEYQSNEGDPVAVWEGQGWVGTDLNKFWIKTEGEFSGDEDRFEELEIQALYSRAVAPFWDLQAGLRHDFKPDPSRSFAVLAVQGLAPYWFEIDTSLFISHKGDVSARLEAEYELLLTQRLILQPRVEMNLALHDDEPTGTGSGLNNFEAGLRLRYEIIREFAPYIGINWNRFTGETADMRRREGEAAESLSFVAGIRFWY